MLSTSCPIMDPVPVLGRKPPLSGLPVPIVDSDTREGSVVLGRKPPLSGLPVPIVGRLRSRNLDAGTGGDGSSSTSLSDKSWDIAADKILFPASSNPPPERR